MASRPPRAHGREHERYQQHGTTVQRQVGTQAQHPSLARGVVRLVVRSAWMSFCHRCRLQDQYSFPCAADRISGS